MATAPPLPPGFVYESPPRRRDPWEILREEGFTATNGYRTDTDVARIRRQGYTPRTSGPHNRGDGVDLDHPRLSRRQQTRRLRELARQHNWDGAEIIDEGHHRHLGIPGWGAAPGTPGTANSGLPAFPEGFRVEQRGPITPGNFVEGGGNQPPAAPGARPPALPQRSSFVAPQQQVEVGGFDAAAQPTNNEARQQAITRALDALMNGAPDEQVRGIMEAAGGLGTASDPSAVSISSLLEERRRHGQAEFVRRNQGGYRVDPSSYEERPYNGFASDIDRGIGGLALTIDTAAYGLEQGARALMGDQAVDGLNRGAERLGAYPGGARGVLAEHVAQFNNMPRNPDLAASMERAGERGSFLGGASSIIGDVAQNPLMGAHLVAEMAPSFAIGGGVGRVAQSTIAPLTANVAARMAAGGAGFGTGQTISQTGVNVAGLVEGGMPLEEAVNRGVRMTAGQIPGAAASGALIPWRPFSGAPGAVGNVLAQVPIQATGGALSAYGGNVAAGVESRPSDIGAIAGLSGATAPADFLMGSYYRRGATRQPAARNPGTEAPPAAPGLDMPGPRPLSREDAYQAGLRGDQPPAGLDETARRAFEDGREDGGHVRLSETLDDSPQGQDRLLDNGAGEPVGATVRTTAGLRDRLGDTPPPRSPDDVQLGDDIGTMGREQYNRQHGRLWLSGADELDALFTRAKQSELDQLRQAVQLIGIEPSPALARQLANPRADWDRTAAAIEREAEAAGRPIPPEADRIINPRWDDPPLTDLPMSEDISTLQQAIAAAAGDDPHSLASEIGWALRGLDADDMTRVLEGRGNAAAQARMLTVRLGVQRLVELGQPMDTIPDILARTMVRNGVSPSNAAELTANAMQALQNAGRTGSRPAPALDGPASARTAAMDAEGLGGPEVVGPTARQVDRIDINDLPPLPEGFRPESFRLLEPPLGRPPARGERPSSEELADIARNFDPEAALPRPANRVRSIDEHIEANEGRWQEVTAPNERAELTMRTFPNPRNPDKPIRFRGPIDAETFLRTQGGIRDYKGELEHLGIRNNAGRPEVPGEARLGKLLNPNGMDLDEAAFRLWEAGYFPHMAERPTVDDLLDVLRASRNGQRTVLPHDVDELDAYHAAQAQRFAVEAAGQEGTRLTEDPTSDVTLADLDANAPPVTAYEDLPDLADRVGNINLAHIESAEDIGRLLQNVETAFGGFGAARRGKLTFAEIEALAAELGMTADDLLSRRTGQALNAEQALAARALLAKSADEVIELAGRARAGSDADRSAFAQALLRHGAIQEQVTGAAAEAGRALSSLRAAARSRMISNRIHEITAQSMGGQQRLEDIADHILDLKERGLGPGPINDYAANAIKPRFSDMLQELWYNSLLSGPKTHAVNTLSNLMTNLLQFPEQVTASALGQGRRAIRRARGRPDDFDRVTMSEIGPRLIGYMQGTREGITAFRHTFRTGEVSDHVTKVESRVQEAIPGRLGKVIRFPSRMLASEDEFFKAVARRMELSAQAARLARIEGLRGDEYKARVQELTNNPTDELLERSLDYARYLTFQRPTGPIGQRISATTQELPWLKLFVPFVRTPTNILKYAVERSPAAPFMREVRANFRAGGERRHLAAAKMMLGTGLGLTIAQLVAGGSITGGGPAARGAEDLMRADGWQPYSIRIGDTYYSYERLDPLALTLGVAADLMSYSDAMTQRQSENATALLITSIMRNLSNKTWLSGMSDIFETLADPERNLGQFIGRLAGSLAVPTGVSQVARSMDPVQRDTRAPIGGPSGWGPLADKALGSIQNRVPGLSSSLPARRDVFGGEVVGPGGAEAMSPIWTRAARQDPIIREMLSISANIGQPQRFVRIDGQRRDLTPEEFGRYSEISGRYIYQDLQAAIAEPRWQTLDPQQRVREVSRIKREARAAARDELLLDAPPLPEGFQAAPVAGGR